MGIYIIALDFNLAVSFAYKIYNLNILHAHIFGS